MKIELTEQKPDFSPFSLTFTVESRTEALRLRAVLNHTTLSSWLHPEGPDGTSKIVDALDRIAGISLLEAGKAHTCLVALSLR